MIQLGPEISIRYIPGTNQKEVVFKDLKIICSEAFVSCKNENCLEIVTGNSHCILSDKPSATRTPPPKPPRKDSSSISRPPVPIGNRRPSLTDYQSGTKSRSQTLNDVTYYTPRSRTTSNDENIRSGSSGSTHGFNHSVRTASDVSPSYTTNVSTPDHQHQHQHEARKTNQNDGLVDHYGNRRGSCDKAKNTITENTLL